MCIKKIIRHSVIGTKYYTFKLYDSKYKNSDPIKKLRFQITAATTGMSTKKLTNINFYPTLKGISNAN